MFNRWSFFFLLSLFLSGSAFAQVLNVQNIDPSRVQERLATQPQQPVRASEVTTPGERKIEALPGAEKVTLTLHKIKFTGNTVFTTAELEPLYEDKLGKKISVADIQKIAHEITVKYREAGYILSQVIIPPQKVEKDGIVEMQVIEGHIDRVDVKGDAKAANKKLLLAYADHISAQKPLTLKVLERYALLANDLPGLTVRTVISPSKDKPGAADLTFVVTKKLFDAFVGYDNRSTKLLGPREMTGGLYINSLGIFPGAKTGVRTVLSDDTNELRYYEFTHGQQIGSDGLRFFTAADYTETKPDFAAIGLAGLPITGESVSATFGLNYPVIRARKQNLYINVLFKLLNSRSNFTNIPLFRDQVRSMRAGATYDFADDYKGINVIGGELSQGVNWFGSKAMPPSRLGGDLTYTKVNGNVSRLQLLPKNFSFLLAGTGQYAFDPLLSSEEFGYGGQAYGVAYDPSEIIGDRGIAGKAELRYDMPFAQKVFRQIQLYGFYDAGRIWNINKLTQPGRQSGTSAGGGVRFTMNKYVQGYFVVAKPLTRIVNNDGNKDVRGFFSITATV